LGSALEAAGAAPGDSDLRLWAVGLSADLGRRRCALRGLDPRARRAARALRARRPRGPHLRRDRPHGCPRGGPRAADRPRAAWSRAPGPRLAAPGVRRGGLRDLGGGGADGGADDDGARHGRRGEPRHRPAAAARCPEPRLVAVRGRPRKAKGPATAGPFAELESQNRAYIIPPMSGMPAPAPAASFSGGSATIASVVRMFLAIDAAFWSAERVTMVGSMTPSLIRSPYSPLSASRPSPGFSPRIFSTTTEPSSPEFSAICRIGSSSALRMISA